MIVVTDKYALTAIHDAVASINPTVDRHAVIMLAPGDYSIDGLVMKPFVHLRSYARDAVALFGQATLSPANYFDGVRFEASENPADASLVGNNPTGLHIRNCSFLSGPQSGPFRTGKFLQITGDTMLTVLLENLVVDYRGEEFAISIEGPPTGESINADLTMDNVFLDAFGAAAGGGCLSIKNVWNARAFGRRWRTSPVGKCIKLERTPGVTGNVDFLIESLTLEWGNPSIHVGENTNLFVKHSSWDTAVVKGNLYFPSNSITQGE